MASNDQNSIVEVKDSDSSASSAKSSSEPQVSISSVSGSRMNLQPNGNSPTATEKLKQNTETSGLPESGSPNVQSVSREGIKNGDSAMESKNATGPAASNENILNHLSPARKENVTDKNVMNDIVPASISSGVRTMIQTPGMSQHGKEGIQQPLGVTNSSKANMPLEQQTSGPCQSVGDNLVIWEGELCDERHGQSVFLTELTGSRMRAASATLAEDWPHQMQIVRVISQDHMHIKKYAHKADYLVFSASNQHEFLGQLREKKLCAVIQLPSQTLLLSVSDKPKVLMGMLFLGYLPSFLSSYITDLDAGASSMVFETAGEIPASIHMPNIISAPTALPAGQSVVSLGQSGMTSMVGSGSLMGTAQISQGTILGSNISGNLNNGMSQPFVSPQLAVRMGQSPGQGNHSGGQIQQSGTGMNQNKMNVLGPTGTSFGATQISQNTILGSNISGKSNNGMSQPLVSPQLAVRTGVSPGQGNHSGGQMQQSGIGMNQNKMNVLGPTATSFGSGTIFPTRGMSMKVQAGIQPFGVADGSTSGIPLPKEISGTPQSAVFRPVRFWEGSLFWHGNGQPEFIANLVGYRWLSAFCSEMFAVGWPQKMHISELLSSNPLDNREYVGKAEVLSFHALNTHFLLGVLQERKLFAVIQLPSQKLVLSTSAPVLDPSYLDGQVFPVLQQHQQQHGRLAQLTETGPTSNYSDSNRLERPIHRQSHARQVCDSRLAKKPKI